MCVSSQSKKKKYQLTSYNETEILSKKKIIKEGGLLENSHELCFFDWLGFIFFPLKRFHFFFPLDSVEHCGAAKSSQYVTNPS